MTTQLTPKLPQEHTLIDADFAALIDTGVTLNTPVVTVAWFDGALDASPNAMLSGVPVIGSGANASKISQMFIGGVAGATYLITFFPTDSQSQLQAVQYLLPVVSIRLG